MRLPAELQFGVQSLGRPDVNAPINIGSAEARASAAWADAITTATNTVATVALASGVADADLTLSERIAADKKSAAELDQYLINTRVIDLGRDDIPESVRTVAENFADMNGLESGLVDTYEIAIEATESHYKRTSEASLLALTEHFDTDRTQTAYNRAMDNVWATGGATAVNTHITQRLEHLAARAELQLTQALSSLDEGEAYRVIVQAEQTGVWTPDVAGEKLAAVGAAIDKLTATRMYSDADTQAAVDAADDFVDQSRLSPEQHIAMIKISDQRQEHLYTVDQRKYGVNYLKAQGLLVENKLTKKMLVDMAANDDITGGQLNTLRTALNTPVPLISTPGVVDRLTGEITALRFATDDHQPITERVASLRKSLLAQFTGVGETGSVAKTLTGEDFSALMTELDDAEDRALGKGGQRYSTAAKTIKSLTGYSDAISKMIEGPYPAGQAYSAFTIALQDYMNRAGVDAEPEEFIARNAQRFTADIYVKQLHERLSTQYPQYGHMIRGLIAPPGGIQDAPMTVGAVLNAARVDFLNRKLSGADWENIRRSLEYMTFDSPPSQSSGGGGDGFQ